MSDLVQFVANLIPGSKVVEAKTIQSKHVSKARRKRSDFSNDDFECKTKEKEEVPYGFTALLNNCISNNKKMLLLRDGFISDEEIITAYDNMRDKMNGKRSCLMSNEFGEVVTFKARSRWNNEFDYGGYVGRRFLDEIDGLKKCSHLILTIDPKKVPQYIPSWWCWGDREFLSVVIGFMVSEFLRSLRIYKKKNKEPWNFLTWVLEWQENGYPHIHLMFYGGWIANLDVLTRLWPFSDANGVRLGKRKGHHDLSGKGVTYYLTKYLTKDLNYVSNKEMKRCAAFIWYFGRRLFNIRHHAFIDGKLTLGISQIEKIKWFRYKEKKRLPFKNRFPTHDDAPVLSGDLNSSAEYYASIEGDGYLNESERYVEGVKMTGNLKSDIKLIQELPVKYDIPKWKE